MSKKYVVVTRAAAQSESFSDSLEGLGFDTLKLPLIETRILVSEIPAEITASLVGGEFDWLLFSSPNSVKYFFQVLSEVPDLRNCRIGVVGIRTEKELLDCFGRKADLIPPKSTARSLLEALGDVEGKRVLSPGPVGRLGILEQGLQESAAIVEVFNIYETVPVQPPEETLNFALKSNPRDLVWSFFSPTAFRSALDLIGPQLLSKGSLVSIGPTTTSAIKAAGLETIEAKKHSEAGVIDCLRLLEISN